MTSKLNNKSGRQEMINVSYKDEKNQFKASGIRALVVCPKSFKITQNRITTHWFVT